MTKLAAALNTFFADRPRERPRRVRSHPHRRSGGHRRHLERLPDQRRLPRRRAVRSRHAHLRARPRGLQQRQRLRRAHPALPAGHAHLRGVHHQRPVPERGGVLELPVCRVLRRRVGVQQRPHLLLAALREHRHQHLRLRRLRQRLRPLPERPRRLHRRRLWHRRLLRRVRQLQRRHVWTRCETDTSSTDPNNCGTCGVVCPAGDGCSGGQRAWAPAGPAGPAPARETCCGALCANTQADNNNCGGCGIVHAGRSPRGRPRASARPARSPRASPASPTATAARSSPTGARSSTSTDPKNCGFCGNACAAGGSCVAGVCQSGPCSVSGCPGGQTCCNAGTTCADTNNDLSNPQDCGGCGVVPAAPARRASWATAPAAACWRGSTSMGRQTCCASGLTSDTQNDPPVNRGTRGVTCPGMMNVSPVRCRQRRGPTARAP